MVTIKTGDILKATEDIIGHQVNCFGAAGGLAYHVFDKYPAAEQDYMQMIYRSNPWALLGLTILTGQQPDGKIIANIFGQYHPGADYRPDKLEHALKQLGDHARALKCSVALPWRISCGICGGDWNEVQEIIERTMEGVECVIYRRECDE